RVVAHGARPRLALPDGPENVAERGVDDPPEHDRRADEPRVDEVVEGDVVPERVAQYREAVDAGEPVLSARPRVEDEDRETKKTTPARAAAGRQRARRQ